MDKFSFLYNEELNMNFINIQNEILFENSLYH